MSRLIIYPIVILFIGMLCFALLPTVTDGCGELGRRTSCKSNLREFMKLFQVYEETFGNGPPMETAGGNGTSQLKALLYGAWNGKDRSPGKAVLKSPKLFICPVDADVEQGDGSLHMLRVKASFADFHRYTSYVLAAQNLKEPGDDQVVMADDAENGKTGLFYDGGRIRLADAQGDGSGSPGFNSYGKKLEFYAHQEGGVAIMGDNSAIFLPGRDGILKEMQKGNPKSVAALSCYY